MRRTILSALAIGVGLVSSAAWAGDLRCVVTGKEGPQPSVQVTLTPGGATLTTARDGTCLFTGLKGTYRVAAEKIVAGKLRGAVQDEVRVPASGRADIRLQLVRAVHIHEYTPLRHGSTWSYRRWTYTWQHHLPWLAGPGWYEVGTPGTMEATAVGPTRFAGADVTKVERKLRGILGGWHPYHTVYETSGSAGHATHGQVTHGHTLRVGEEASLGYEPPLLIPDLCPLGYAHRLTTRVRYTDGTPSRRVTRTYTLTKLDRFEVEAGVFDDCACIEWTEEAGDTTMTGTMRLAKGVGLVVMSFDDGQTKEHWELKEYHTPTPAALSAAGTAPGATKPRPPASAVKTPGKSLPIR